MKKYKAVALVSGGLDSLLAIKMMQNQGIEVFALHLESRFFSKEEGALEKRMENVKQLGCSVKIIDFTEILLATIKDNEHGYGSALNPCLDCHMMQQKVAKEYMDEIGADFIITGEVAGQRAKSQKKRDLEFIWDHLDFGDLVLRPLSAKVLPPTLPEREGWVDREQLQDIEGRQRQVQMRLAEEWNLTYPSPAGGCMLTEKVLGQRLKEQIDYRDSINEDIIPLDYDTLWWGRHYRLEDGNKVIVARNSEEGDRFIKAFEANRDKTVFVSLKSDKGPIAIIILRGELTEDLKTAASFLITKHYKDKADRKFLFELEDHSVEFDAGEDKKYTAQVIKVVNSYKISTGLYKETV